MTKINASIHQCLKGKLFSKPSNWKCELWLLMTKPMLDLAPEYLCHSPMASQWILDDIGILGTSWNTIHAHGPVLTRQIFKVPSIRCTTMDVDGRSKNYIGTFTLHLAPVSMSFRNLGIMEVNQRLVPP